MLSRNIKKCYNSLEPFYFQGVINKRYENTTTLKNPFEDSLKTPKPYHELPAPPMWPFIGSVWLFLPIIGRYSLHKQHLANRHKRQLYGNIWREKFGPFNIVISYQAEDMETLFKNEGPYPNRSGMACLEKYRESRKHWYKTTGLLVLNDKQWLDLRKKTQKHLLKPKAVEAYVGSMHDVACDFVQRMHHMKDLNHEIPDFLQELYKWSLESVALVGLDARLGCFQSKSIDSDGLKLIQTVQFMFEKMNQLELLVRMFKKFPVPGWKKFEKAADEFSEIAFKYINRSCEELKKIDKTEEKELTLLQALLTTDGLELGEAMVTVADMLFAGIDTTAHAAGFLLYELAKNQDKQELLYEEVAKLFPSSGEKMTPAILRELRYLKSCLKESLRLHHLIPASGRVIDYDIVMSGYRIPSKTLAAVILPDVAIDERYFKNPAQFVPERWLNREVKCYPFAYLPFGFGPRSCIGRRIAELEIICLITEIIRNFKVEYHHEDIDIFTRFINTPDKPLRFSFIERR